MKQVKKKQTRKIPVRSTKLDKKKFVALAAKRFGAGATLTKDMVREIVEDYSLPYPIWFTNNRKYRNGWGKYDLPLLNSHVRDAEAGVIKIGNLSNIIRNIEVVDENTIDGDEFQFGEDETETEEYEYEGDDEDMPSLKSQPTIQLESPLVSERQPQVHQHQHHALVPRKDDLYVPWGSYHEIRTVIEKKVFYNVFITGLSGNGKTTMVEQICAELKRELIRANITYDTDANDLFGGFRLINGNTVWFDGPVVLAMKAGAVLLLDEVDLASAKIMCLQPVLEGKPILLKQTGELVVPAPGFTIIATANTKGKGSEDGRFVGTQVLNEAFLDRFPATIEQSYPPKSIEKEILTTVFRALNVEVNEDLHYTIDILVAWAETIRNRFMEGDANEVVSTRRLVDVAKGYAIFGNVENAIKKSIARFDETTKDGFLKYYQMHVDEERKKQEQAVAKKRHAAEEERTAVKVKGFLADPNTPAAPGAVIFRKDK